LKAFVPLGKEVATSPHVMYAKLLPSLRSRLNEISNELMVAPEVTSRCGF